ncbi:MAG: hypothetical protein K6F05_04600 [Succinivibrio sp.]|nr:hypothetical protein [Succinivibrio sp.]
MSDKLDTFIKAADSTAFESRNVIIDGDSQKVRLGNLIFSESRGVNSRTMAAFKSALEQQHGRYGLQAFEQVLSSREKHGKPLRACDVTSTICSLALIKYKRLKNEVLRQLDTTPQYQELPQATRLYVKSYIAEQNPLKYGARLAQVKTPAQLNHLVQELIGEFIRNCEKAQYTKYHGGPLGKRTEQLSKRQDEPTGLVSLKEISYGAGDTSVEDRLNSGKLQQGERVNFESSSPMLFDKLKTNGVEPGFICHKDWSLDDTKSLMVSFDSPKSQALLAELKAKNQDLAAKCAGLGLREQLMLCGHAHPAAMSAVADYILEQELNRADSELCRAFKKAYPKEEPQNFRALDQKKLKKQLFVELRDAVLAVDKDSPTYSLSPIFKNFADRYIVKLDYNESERVVNKSAAHAGLFMRPKRTAKKRNAFYRLGTSQSATSMSVGAVTEALANDLGRICGVPSQDLKLVRGQFSNGHPKMLLEAQFADGYQDIQSYLKDGQVVPPKHEQFEKIGKYKAFFLVMADRDAVGKYGQNKGFAHGRFFAIDPGHSLEGNGHYVEIHDNLDFTDHHKIGFGHAGRFANYSVFDDDTRFAKFQGVLKMRELKQSGRIAELFGSYAAMFNPDDAILRRQNVTAHQREILDSEKQLRVGVRSKLAEKQTEFNTSLDKLLNVMDSQLRLYDGLQADGAAVQEGAIETIENLEKLTSPTTWVSPQGRVQLDHLKVIKQTRVPWSAQLEGESIVYKPAKALSVEAKANLTRFIEGSGAFLQEEDDGQVRVVVPKAHAQAVFASLSESRVASLKHAKEYQARTARHA